MRIEVQTLPRWHAPRHLCDLSIRVDTDSLAIWDNADSRLHNIWPLLRLPTVISSAPVLTAMASRLSGYSLEHPTVLALLCTGLMRETHTRSNNSIAVCFIPYRGNFANPADDLQHLGSSSPGSAAPLGVFTPASTEVNAQSTNHHPPDTRLPLQLRRVGSSPTSTALSPIQAHHHPRLLCVLLQYGLCMRPHSKVTHLMQHRSAIAGSLGGISSGKHRWRDMRLRGGIAATESPP